MDMETRNNNNQKIARNQWWMAVVGIIIAVIGVAVLMRDSTPLQNNETSVSFSSSFVPDNVRISSGTNTFHSLTIFP